MSPRYQSDEDRITRNVTVDHSSDCWNWQRRIHRTGYGALAVGGRCLAAHRFSYEAFVGPIPEGLQLDHLCRNRACVNPAHLEPVTNRENALRAPESVAAINLQKTHCPSGHPYNDENTIRQRSGSRLCRACQRIHGSRSARAARRASKLAVSA